MATPLERPELPAIDARVAPGGRVIAIFGPGDRAFAEAIAAARPEAAIVEATLRHAPGWERRGDGVVAHPDALVEALRASWPPAQLVLGVGAPFAVAVRASLAIWIADGLPILGLPPPLRAVAREAALVLEEARPAVAAHLAPAL